VIVFPGEAIQVIHDHVRRGYPHESCGGLLGRITNGTNGDARRIVRVVPVENERSENKERRYLISSEAVRALAAQASREGLELLGFYHSHPDHPAEPSPYDLDHSWPWYTYLIVEVRRREVRSARAWRLADDRSSFVEQQLKIRKEDAV